MLTEEKLKANEGLALSDEQIAAITAMSKADENEVIGNRFRDVYNEFDSKIERITNIKRNGDEKTYNYFERAISEVMQSNNGEQYQQEIDSLKKEKADLESQIASGSGDEATKKALVQANADLNAVKAKYSELKVQHEEAKKGFDKEMLDYKISNDLQRSISGINLKKEIPENAAKSLLAQAVEKVKNMGASYVDNALVFADENGATMRNPENNMAPFTARELIEQELKTLGILDNGRQAAGAGTVPTGGSKGGTLLDLSGAKTRTQANDMAREYLLKNGLAEHTEDFQKQMLDIWTTNKISELPLK